MAEEEFQESEVIFSDDNESNTHFDRFPEIFHVSSKHGRFVKSGKSNGKNKKNDAANSVPVNIPDSVFRFGDNDGDFEGDWIDSDGELIPPHVIVGRRIGGGKMAYSVCTGTGRTLKGRDLSRVRNSVLRLTGFLET